PAYGFGRAGDHWRRPRRRRDDGTTLRMLTSTVVATIGFALRHARLVVALSVLLTLAAGIYAAMNFALTTDIGRLIAPDRPWRQREIAFAKSFPQYDRILV